MNWILVIALTVSNGSGGALAVSQTTVPSATQERCETLGRELSTKYRLQFRNATVIWHCGRTT